MSTLRLKEASTLLGSDGSRFTSRRSDSMTPWQKFLKGVYVCVCLYCGCHPRHSRRLWVSLSLPPKCFRFCAIFSFSFLKTNKKPNQNKKTLNCGCGCTSGDKALGALLTQRSKFDSGNLCLIEKKAGNKEKKKDI